MDDQAQLNAFLVQQHYMTIAVTLDDGTPWAVPVRIKRRDGTIFEWDSRTDTEHSMAITKRPSVAISMYSPKTDTTIHFGFYAMATAKLVSEHDGVGLYQATVSEAWINDASFIKRSVSLQ